MRDQYDIDAACSKSVGNGTVYPGRVEKISCDELHARLGAAHLEIISHALQTRPVSAYQDHLGRAISQPDSKAMLGNRGRAPNHYNSHFLLHLVSDQAA